MADTFVSLGCRIQFRRRVFCDLFVFTISCVLLIFPLGLLAAAQSDVLQQTQFTFWPSIPAHNITFLGNTAFASNGSIFLTSYRNFTPASLSSVRALYNTPLQFGSYPRTFSFSTSFTFQIISPSGSIADGMAFVIVPDNHDPPPNSVGGYLGLVNITSIGRQENHLFAVEFDTWKDVDFLDDNNNHVGIDVNSVVSSCSVDLSAKKERSIPSLQSNGTITAWIDYNGASETIEVRLANDSAATRPGLPVLSCHYNLSQVWKPYMYVGFSAGTGGAADIHNIYSWNFSSILSSVAASPILASRSPNSCKGRLHCTKFVLGISVGLCITFVLAVVVGISYTRLRMKRKLMRGDTTSMLELPASFTYRELSSATNGFSTKRILGKGAFGTVYKGILSVDKSVVAVKRFSEDLKQGEQSFLTEIAVIGRLRHRNLVPLRGWCHERGKLLLVYEYMAKGSLDALLFESSKQTVLDWDRRYHILKGVAAALVYLHEEWEQQVLHRDVKPGNILLDSDFNARLGDFGLARLLHHSRTGKTMTVVGTLGYMAPELALTARATEKSDVYSFGILTLEVACGRPSLDTQLPGEGVVLLDWVWVAHESGNILDVVDAGLAGKYDEERMQCSLHLGLMCCHPDPKSRPSMRYVYQILCGQLPPPWIRSSRPVVSYSAADRPSTPGLETQHLLDNSSPFLTQRSRHESSSKSASLGSHSRSLGSHSSVGR